MELREGVSSNNDTSCYESIQREGECSYDRNVRIGTIADNDTKRDVISTVIATSSADNNVLKENFSHIDDDDDDDWEEWDGNSPFWIHCTAGSIAGVIEHSATYPLDTVRTHIQVCAACIERQKQVGLLNKNTGTTTAGALNTINPKTLLQSSVNGISRATSTAAATATTTSHLPLGVWQTIRYLVSEPTVMHGTPGFEGASVVGVNPLNRVSAASVLSSTAIPSSTSLIQGWSRLWRGVQTVVIGCIPAHALYFSSYEMVKSACTDHQTGILPTWGSSAAGAVAAMGHDIIMTPLDTIKQRMQLGYHTGVIEAIKSIITNESYIALYRSFPVTLATNIPYGMIMVTTNETCKSLWISTYHSEDKRQLSKSSSSSTFMFLMSSSMAGLVASAITTPLDRIKTSLQTQQLAPNCIRGRLLMNSATNNTVPASSSSLSATPTTLVCRQALSSITAPTRSQLPLSSSSSLNPAAKSGLNNYNSINNNWYQAAKTIYVSEGTAGFFRGMIPRVLSHTPAVAISWTAYESIKQYLMTNYHQFD